MAATAGILFLFIIITALTVGDLYIDMFLKSRKKSNKDEKLKEEE